MVAYQEFSALRSIPKIILRPQPPEFFEYLVCNSFPNFVNNIGNVLPLQTNRKRSYNIIYGNYKPRTINIELKYLLVEFIKHFDIYIDQSCSKLLYTGNFQVYRIDLPNIIRFENQVISKKKFPQGHKTSKIQM